MNQEFIGALKEIVKDKGISEDLLFTTIEDALVAAYKKNYAGPTSSAQNVKVTIDRESGEIHVYSQKVVVEEVFDNVTEIGLEEAQEIKPTYDLDDIVDCAQRYGINLEKTKKKYFETIEQVYQWLEDGGCVYFLYKNNLFSL